MDEQPTLRDRVLAYVLQTDHVSFAELGNHFEGFRGGDFQLQKGENIILWAGLSQEAVNVMGDLLDSGAIEPHPASILVYLIDGCSLTLPLVKQARKYKTPHWLPVTLRPPGRSAPAKRRSARRNDR
jgi:hypothetical protein